MAATNARFSRTDSAEPDEPNEPEQGEGNDDERCEMTEGAWPDPSRGTHSVHRSRSRSTHEIALPKRRRPNPLRFAASVVGWPVLVVIGASLPSGDAVQRAVIFVVALGLLLEERWREAMRRREDEETAALARAMVLEEQVAFSPTWPVHPPPHPSLVSPKYSSPTALDVGFSHSPRLGTMMPAPSLPPSVHDRPTTIERHSQQLTLPNSERGIHVDALRARRR